MQENTKKKLVALFGATVVTSAFVWLGVLLFILFMSSTAFGSDKTKADLTCSKSYVNNKKIKLNDNRTLVLRGPIDEGSVAPIVANLKQYATASSTAPIYLVIDSPGGSVPDGYNLIQVMDASKTPVICLIDNTAASMAAVLSQFCTETYATKYSMIMFHEASSGIGADMITHLPSRIAFLFKYIHELDSITAKQMGLSYDEYIGKQHFEWWMTASEAASCGIIDGLLESLFYKEPPKKETNPLNFIFGGE